MNNNNNTNTSPTTSTQNNSNNKSHNGSNEQNQQHSFEQSAHTNGHHKEANCENTNNKHDDDRNNSNSDKCSPITNGVGKNNQIHANYAVKNYDNLNVSNGTTNGKSHHLTDSAQQIVDDKVEITVAKDDRYQDFGFNLSKSLHGNGIYVDKIRLGSPAENNFYLKPNTKLFKVNKHNLYISIYYISYISFFQKYIDINFYILNIYIFNLNIRYFGFKFLAFRKKFYIYIFTITSIVLLCALNVLEFHFFFNKISVVFFWCLEINFFLLIYLFGFLLVLIYKKQAFGLN